MLGVLQVERTTRQERTAAPPPAAPIGALALYADLTFIAQIIRVVMETIGSARTHVAPTVQPALVVTTPTDNVVILV
jgi:hypothetical protein